MNRPEKVGLKEEENVCPDQKALGRPNPNLSFGFGK